MCLVIVLPMSVDTSVTYVPERYISIPYALFSSLNGFRKTSLMCHNRYFSCGL